MEELLQEVGTTAPVVEKPKGWRARWSKPTNSGKKGGKRKWVLLGAAVLVLGGAALGWRALAKDDRAAAQTSYTEIPVSGRSIVQSLSGSGTLQPADSYTVNTLVSGEIVSDGFEEGDLVEKGALLYTLDASNAQTSQTKAQNSYDQAQKAKYPTATMSGTVSEVLVKNGQTVNAGTELCRIVGDNNLYIDFLFTYTDSGSFYVGQNATVFVEGLAGTIAGTVSAVSGSTTVSDNGKVLTTVRVKAANPGLVTEGYTASAVIGDNMSYGEAKVNLSGTSVVTASASGTVENLSLLAGDTVTSGQRICTITGDSVDDQLENARLSLENAQDSLDDYRITAPISGTVVTKTAKAGDKVEGSGNGTLCTIYDLSYLEMTLNIDELDIGSVEVGQTVAVTADAVSDRTYTGVITKVSVAGTTSNGTTSYPVTVRIDETDGLLPGMNVSAEIVLASADNALSIPGGAVNRGNTVLVTAASPSAVNAMDREVPEGYVYVEVTTGVSDDDYIEILSGLQKGDTVAYLPTTSGSSEMGMMMMPMGGMGASVSMSGGAPSGGPGGGRG